MSEEKESTSDDPIVVLEQDLLNLPECFIYRIPPMRSAEGHRAEDWNLPSPLATCSLKTIRRDNSLLVKLLASRPKKNGPPGSTEDYLFAQSTVTFPMNKANNENNNHHHPNFAQQLDHSITNVVDSSRYFVIRIQNEKTKREASIGVGFRERDDATNFKMACMEFVKIMTREYKVLHNIHDSAEMSGGGDALSALSSMNNLSLKDGEKIHVSIPLVKVNKDVVDEQHGHKHKQSDYRKKKALIGKGGLFLKKPPPPPSPSANTEEKNVDDQPKDSADVENKQAADEIEEQATLPNDNDISSAPSCDNLAKDDEKVETDDKEKVESEQAATNDDDDEWGDFESG